MATAFEQMAKGMSFTVPCPGIYWRVARPVQVVLYCSSWRSRAVVSEIQDLWRLSFSWIWDNEGHPSQCLFTLEFDFLGFLGRKKTKKQNPTVTSFHLICFQLLSSAAPHLSTRPSHLRGAENKCRLTCLSSRSSFFQKDIAPFFAQTFRIWESDDRDCYRFER